MAKILVIDDEPLVCETLQANLELAGHQVSVAEDGEEGLKLNATGSPDVVITDIIMPNQEGLETIIELRNKRPNLPIIAISGGSRISELDLLRTAQKLGANHVFQKPIGRQELLQAVEECLEASSAASLSSA